MTDSHPLSEQLPSLNYMNVVTNLKRGRGQNQPSPPSYLLELPLELRGQILRELLVSDEPLKFHPPADKPNVLNSVLAQGRKRRNEDDLSLQGFRNTPRSPFPLNLAILAVNHQLRKEAAEIFYGQNSMSFRVTASGRHRGDPFEPRLSIYNHTKRYPMNPQSQNPLTRPNFFKVKNISLRIVLDETCFRSPAAWALRYLVNILNESYPSITDRSLTIEYEDRALDGGICPETTTWTGRCICNACEVQRKTIGRNLPLVLRPLVYLKGINNVSLNFVQPVSDLGALNGQPLDSQPDLPYPSEVMQHIVDPSFREIDIYPKYMYLISYLENFSAVDISRNASFPFQPTPLVDLTTFSKDGTDVIEDTFLDLDRMGIVSRAGKRAHRKIFPNDPSGLGRCPSWIISDMQVVMRAMVKGDMETFSTLQSQVLDRVDLHMKELRRATFG